MFGVKKRRILSWSVTISLLFSCSPEASHQIEIHGSAQGTTYTVILTDSGAELDKSELDSLFKAFDQSLSTYVEDSRISRLNRSKGLIMLDDPNALFERCYTISQEVYQRSDGYFDPSVYPLVEGWGFMNDVQHPLDSSAVDSILHFVSFEKGKLHDVRFESGKIHFQKHHPAFKLDFNAIAQGLSVDVVDDFLASKGFKNYYIEVGGEIIVRGKNQEGNDWRVGVDTPIQNTVDRVPENVLHVTNKGIATSGNYRKFYTYEGKTYAHTLNPKTGFPVQHTLLSATVVADDAARADAYATFFMVIGTEEALKFIQENPEEKLNAYLLYADEEGAIQRKMSRGFEKYLREK